MTEGTSEMVKISLPVGVGGLSLLSVSLSDWVLVLTLIYTAILITDKLFPGVLQRASRAVLRWILRT